MCIEVSPGPDDWVFAMMLSAVLSVLMLAVLLPVRGDLAIPERWICRLKYCWHSVALAYYENYIRWLDFRIRRLERANSDDRAAAIDSDQLPDLRPDAVRQVAVALTPRGIVRQCQPPKKNALLRMWELLKLLPQRQPGKTAAALHRELAAHGYPVSKKSVERDLTSLSMIFPILCNEDSKPYYWHWMPNASSGLPGVALTEAIALALVEKTLSVRVHPSLLDPLRQRLEAAHRLISESDGVNKAGGWANKVICLPRDLALLPPPVSAEVFRTIQEVLLKDRQVQIQYHSFEAPAARWRTVNPHALLLKGPVLYLVADEVQTGGEPASPIIKHYALQRMRAARACPSPAAHLHFALTRYMRSQEHEMGSRRAIRVRLRVTQDVQKLLQETPLAPRQRITEDSGAYIVEAAVRDTQGLAPVDPGAGQGHYGAIATRTAHVDPQGAEGSCGELLRLRRIVSHTTVTLMPTM